MDLLELEQNRDRDGFIMLKRTYSELYKRTNYATSLNYVQNTIYEYDIKAANLTMLRKSGEIDSKTLAKLEAMDKQSREVAVGKMIARKKEIYHIIKNGILKARERLFRENSIQDYEVLSIRNDAVFIIGRKLRITEFDGVEFKQKNRYTLFQRINKVEFLYDLRHDTLDVKGINDKILMHPDHQAGMVVFLKTVFKFLCYDRRDELRRYLIKFVHDYKAKELPFQYYREFNSQNLYRTIMEISGFGYNMTEIGQGDLGMINPVFNYKYFVLPLIWQYI